MLHNNTNNNNTNNKYFQSIKYGNIYFNLISKITPFFALDDDPYLVIDNGRLLWIMDAYTISGNFPYSEKFGQINYIRNSVKIVVDAYDGTATYYVMDTSDPLILTYAKISLISLIGLKICQKG